MFDGISANIKTTFSNPYPAPGDAFGGAVCGFGPFILVGAPQSDPNDDGEAYLFDPNGSLQIAIPNPATDPLNPNYTGYFAAECVSYGNGAFVSSYTDRIDGVDFAGRVYRYYELGWKVLLLRPSRACCAGAG